MPDWNAKIIQEFRANDGKVGGVFEGTPLLLLTTMGARSGRPHTVPAMYFTDADRVLVTASNAGADNHPAWYHNMLADPRVTVEIGTETYEATAHFIKGSERDELFARIVDVAPGFADYQAGTSRVIPVIALYRTATAADPARVQALGDHLVEVHDWLRNELIEVQRSVDAVIAGRADASADRPAPGLGMQLHQHCLTFCEHLHGHHANEDVSFPMLEGRFPELAPVLERLRREHHVIAWIIADLRTLLDGLGSGDPVRIREELARLSTELDAHLDWEEEQLVPVLNTLPPIPAGSPD